MPPAPSLEDVERADDAGRALIVVERTVDGVAGERDVAPGMVGVVPSMAATEMTRLEAPGTPVMYAPGPALPEAATTTTPAPDALSEATDVRIIGQRGGREVGAEGHADDRGAVRHGAGRWPA